MRRSDQAMEIKPAGVEDCWNKIGIWAPDGRDCPRLAEYLHCYNCPVFSESACRLLNREPPEDYLAEWSMRLLDTKQTGEILPRSVFAFRIGREWLALPTSCIREVAEMKVVHSIPHRELKFLKGLVNIRGKLEICISLGDIMDIQPWEGRGSSGPHASKERLVLTQEQGSRLAFPVNEVLGIRRYRDEELRPPPANISESKQAYTRGLLKVGDRDVAIIEHELLFKTVARSLA